METNSKDMITLHTLRTWKRVIEKKSMGGEMRFWPLVRPHHSFTSLFSHLGDKF
jgi:hypothetical protein